MDPLFKILKRCLKSDRNSQRHIYEKYYRYSLKIAFRYVDCFNDATTITNDAFVKLFKNLHQFELTDNESVLEARFFGWLKRIVINTALDSLRKNNRDLPVETLDDDCWDIPEINEQADSKLLYKELIGYLKELPPVYNKVFNLFVIDGYTHAEIAELLDISVGTSKSNLFKAKEILQKKVAEFFETNKA